MRLTRRLRTPLIAMFALLAAGAGYERWSRWRAPRQFPPPGEIHQVEGNSLHIRCGGSGTPTVVLEAGAGSSGGAWGGVQPDVEAFSRVCSYDRSGIGWSGLKGGPREPVEAADELHDLLQAAGEEPPFVMVGHSLGGPRTLIFAGRYPAEVAGLVFVDATDMSWMERASPEVASSTSPQWLLGFLFYAGAQTGALRILDALTEASANDTIRAFTPQSVVASFREATSRDEILAAAREVRISPAVPRIVLTAGAPQLAADWSPELLSQVRDLRLNLQRELAEQSENSDHRIVSDAGHFIQNDNPAAVTTAIRDVVVAVRQRAKVRQEGEPHMEP